MQGDLFFGLDEEDVVKNSAKPLIPEYTVSEFSKELKHTIENRFAYVKIRGEVSGYKKSNAGHIYFSLKDNESLINAVCFRNMASFIPMELEDGMEIIVSGKVTIYVGRSNYQIIVENVAFAGRGEIMKLLEERRKKLESEGLFDEDLKKPIPYIPEHIGIITSETGAAIRDILHRIEDRFPTRVTIFPVTVQGLNAPREIIEAIQYFNEADESNLVDVLIVARGGGSLEDLLAFSDENVVRAIAYSDVPIVSGVGHETDTMLIDYASDLRAPTPSAAAELVTPIKEELLYAIARNFDYIESGIQRTIISYQDRLGFLKITPNTIISLLERHKNILSRLMQECNFYVKNSVNLARQKLEFVTDIDESLESCLNKKEQKFKLNSELLESFNPKNILKRGFSIVRSAEAGRILKDCRSIKESDKISIEVSDGVVDLEVR